MFTGHCTMSGSELRSRSEIENLHFPPELCLLEMITQGSATALDNKENDQRYGYVIHKHLTQKLGFLLTQIHEIELELRSKSKGFLERHVEGRLDYCIAYITPLGIFPLRLR